MKPVMENNPCLGEKRLLEEANTPTRRVSRRKLRKEPLDVTGSIDSKACNKEVRRLMMKGESGGKVQEERKTAAK